MFSLIRFVPFIQIAPLHLSHSTDFHLCVYCPFRLARLEHIDWYQLGYEISIKHRFYYYSILLCVYFSFSVEWKRYSNLMRTAEVVHWQKGKRWQKWWESTDWWQMKRPENTKKSWLKYNAIINNKKNKKPVCVRSCIHVACIRACVCVCVRLSVSIVFQTTWQFILNNQCIRGLLFDP